MLKRVVLIFLAVILFAFALLGAILPIIPGFVFLFAGIIVLSWTFESVRNWLHKLLHRFPHIEKYVLKAEEKLKKWLKIK